MTFLSQIKGQRVLTVDDAQQVGSIRRLLVDPGQARVTAVHLEGVSGSDTLLPWPKVKSVGPDALMVETAQLLEEPPEQVRERIDAGYYDLDGRTVYSDAGDSLGQLEDIEFDESSGRVIRLHVPGHALPVPRFVAIGPDAVIVPAEG